MSTRRLTPALTTLVAVAAACRTATPGAAPPVAPVRASAAAPRAADRASRIADSVLALMTLDEKIGQMTQVPAGWSQTGPTAAAGDEQQVREGKVGSFLSFWGAARTLHMQHVAVEQSRLHVPLLFGQDVIHGWRTVFPINLAQAATFDSAGVANAARIAATEASAQGVQWTFAPMIDIARDPRWGRIAEGAGEDPHLGAVMAAAQVRGFQGDDLAAPTTILATAKHFAAYGAAEGGRDYNVADVSERTLLDVYLPPFHAAVRAGVGSLMASFNEIGGTPAHASRWLLTDVLRHRWGFTGLVVSDWAGVEELMAHGIAATRREAARRALDAGVDMEMSSTLYRTELPALVRAGIVPDAAIDSAALRVLRAKAELGLFDDPYRYSDTLRERTAELTPANRAAARALAREAIVLLTNRATGGTPALPLRTTLRRVAVIGPLADDPHAPLGPWNGAGRPEDVVTPLAGIRAALPDARVTYVRGAPIDTVSTAGFAAAERAARDADAVILVLGESADMSGEAASRASIGLPGAQLALAQAVTRAARAADPARPVIAVLMNGRPLAVPWLADSASALVESWFLGVEHGHALADILVGAYDPSGRLPVSIPRATGQIPIYYDHKSTGRPPSDTNKYTSKYIDLPWTPLFPFGYGLSYTSFTYGPLRIPVTQVSARDSIPVLVDVANTGARAGTAVVQLYVRDDAASVTRPVRQLQDFRRVALRPGERRTVPFVLHPDQLAFHDLRMRRVVEPGTFTVWAGGSSTGGAEGHFTVTGDTLVLAPAPPRFK